jgi:DNA-binding SARP family transcriptional activator
LNAARRAKETHAPRPGEQSPVLRIYLLGGFRAERAGEPIRTADWHRRGAARSLVKLLAVTPSHRLHREEILEILWPEVDSDSALNRFGKALHAARRALEPNLSPRAESWYLHLASDLVSLDAASVWIDADDFESMATHALTSRHIVALEAALEAYGGDLLPEDIYEDWSAGHRHAMAELHLKAQLVLAAGLAGVGGNGMPHSVDQEGFKRAEAIWKDVLARDATVEEAHRGLMRLYAVHGARSQALRQYEACGKSLVEEIGAEPEPETQALHKEIVGDRLSPPPQQAAARPISPLAPLPLIVQQRLTIGLVGRDRVLAILEQDAQSCRDGSGHLVLLSGEPGIGKSTLLAEAARRAHQTGFSVLWGTGYAEEEVIPYGLIIEAVQAYLDAVDAGERSALAGRYPSLASLIAGLAPAAEPATVALDPQILHGQISAQLFALLAELADRQPLFLVLDDLHAADASSLHLLRQLAHNADHHRWLIAAAYRVEDVEPHSEISHFLSTFTREALGRRVRLGLLSREDTGALLRLTLPGGEVPESILDRLYALSLGNPLFVQELVRAMREDGSLQPADGRWELMPTASLPLPARVADAVAGRFDSVGADAFQILNLAAIKGMYFSFGTLLRAAAIAFPKTFDNESMMKILDQALEADILEDRGELYAFRHPLVRAALLRRLPSHRRARLHEAVAGAIEHDRPTDFEALAFHYSRSRDPDKAIDYLERAAARAESLFANIEAVRTLSELAHLLDFAGRDEEAARARHRLAYVLGFVGRYGDALAELERSIAVQRLMRDKTDLTMAMALVGHTHLIAGSPREGIERLLNHRAPGLVQSVARAALFAAVAALYWAMGRYVDQLEAATRAVEVLPGPEAEAHPYSERIRACGAVLYAIALLGLERTDEAVAAFEELLPQLEDFQDLLNVSRVCERLAIAYRRRGEASRALASLERGLKAIELLGCSPQLAFMLCRHALLLVEAGKWREAREELERALLVAEETPSWAAPYPLAGLARIAYLEGDWNELGRLAGRAVAVAEDKGEVHAQWDAHSIMAAYELQQGAPTQARRRLEPFVGRTGMTEGDLAVMLSLLARAYLAECNVAGARSTIAGAAELARSHKNLPALMDLLRVQGLVAIEEKQWEEARLSFEEALQLAIRMCNPYAEARVLEAYGEMLAASGNAEEAVGRLEQALELYRSVGAREDARRLETTSTPLRTGETA